MWVNKVDNKKIGMKFAFQVMNKLLSAGLRDELDAKEFFEDEEYEIDDNRPTYWAVIDEVENILEDILENPETYGEMADKEQNLWWNIHYHFGYELPGCVKDMFSNVFWEEE